MSEKEAIERLSNELFENVEEQQGKAFISDGLNACKSRFGFFTAVRGHLLHARYVVHIIENFLRKHEEMEPPGVNNGGR